MNNIKRKEMLQEWKIKYWIKSCMHVGVCKPYEWIKHMQQLNNSLDGYINLWEIISRYFSSYHCLFMEIRECSEWLWSPTTRRFLSVLVFLCGWRTRSSEQNECLKTLFVWSRKSRVEALPMWNLAQPDSLTELSWLFRNVVVGRRTTHYQSQRCKTFNVAPTVYL